MRRGEVWLARFDPVEGSEQVGTSPVVVVGRDTLNRSRHTIVALPITTFRGRMVMPVHCRVSPPEGGLRNESLVVVDQIRALAESRFEAYFGRFSDATMQMIAERLIDVLALRQP